MTSADSILENLYRKYYVQQSPSNVTSSHWKIVGSHSAGEKSGKYTLKGQGFGSFRENSLINKSYYGIELFLTKYMERKFETDQTLTKLAKEICRQTNHLFDYDCLRQILSLQFIGQHLKFSDLNTVCVIGDGYGFMGSLIKKRWPHIKILSINLGKTQMFDVFYTQKAFPLLSYAQVDSPQPELQCDFTFIEAENFELLKHFRIDLFINIASMQEMDNRIINDYFSFMEQSHGSLKWFYCCNRIEKSLPDGEITRIDEYPWSNWKFLKNELCPWYQEFPSSRPPFWRKFDGPIKHILAISASQ